MNKWLTHLSIVVIFLGIFVHGFVAWAFDDSEFDLSGDLESTLVDEEESQFELNDSDFFSFDDPESSSPTTDSLSGSATLEGEASTEERRLFEIYQRFLSQPVSDEDWMQSFSALREDVYVIQPGDTLWELSMIFFGDGHYWAKLWSVNPRLTNPHLIRPGYQIRFVRGGGQVVPQIVVESLGGEEGERLWKEVDDMATVLSPRQQLPDTGDPLYLLSGAPELPGPFYPPTPLLKDIPNTFPERRSALSFDHTGFSFQGRPDIDLSPVVTLSSFVEDEQLNFVGEVVEQTGENEVAAALQYVYVQTDQTVSPGDRLLAVGERVNARSGDRNGTIFDVYGEIEITETLEDNRSRAIVLNAVNGVPKGAHLTAEVRPQYVFSPEGVTRDYEVGLMSAKGDRGPVMFALGSEVYLNRGRRDGLSESDLLPVSVDRSTRVRGAKIQHAPVYAALVKVVRVSEGVSTGVIVRSYDEIRSGDISGQSQIPSRLYPNGNQQESTRYIE